MRRGGDLFMSGNQLELSALKRAWIDDAEKQFLETFSWGGRTFSADDLRFYVNEPPHPNWVGCLMARLRNMNKIREIGRVKSSRPEANGRKISFWEVV
jgi:hypothetical protein